MIWTETRIAKPGLPHFEYLQANKISLWSGLLQIFFRDLNHVMTRTRIILVVSIIMRIKYSVLTMAGIGSETQLSFSTGSIFQMMWSCYICIDKGCLAKLAKDRTECSRTPVQPPPYRRLSLHDSNVLALWPGFLFSKGRGYQSWAEKWLNASLFKTNPLSNVKPEINFERFPGPPSRSHPSIVFSLFWGFRRPSMQPRLSPPPAQTESTCWKRKHFAEEHLLNNENIGGKYLLKNELGKHQPKSICWKKTKTLA